MNLVSKNRTLLALSLGIFLTAFTTSCKKDNKECKSKEVAYVTSVKAPESSNVNKKTTIEVNFNLKNECGKFSKFSETKNKNVTVVEVEAQYEGCDCKDKVVAKKENFEFTPKSVGEYVFSFKSGKKDFNNVTVNVK